MGRNIIRNHRDGGTVSWAEYSPCEAYRYVLAREWMSGRKLTYVMLNPSTATELANDATIERCQRRARMLGYGAMRIVNLFAFRATQPSVLMRAIEPVGPDNDKAILEAADWADDVLCAWGAHGLHAGRGRYVADMLAHCGAPLFHLGLTKSGSPRHPLYISYRKKPQPFQC